MGRITIILLMLNTISNCSKTMENKAIYILNPDQQRIDFEIINPKNRQYLLKNEVKELLRVDTFLFNIPIHILKDGTYLVGYTISDFAIRFKNEEYLNLFMSNENYFDASLFIRNNAKYYSFWIKSNDKIIELLKNVDREIEGYPNKSPMLNFKLYLLKNGKYLRSEKRAENVYSAYWYPDLETFEYFYKNGYAS